MTTLKPNMLAALEVLATGHVYFIMSNTAQHWELRTPGSPTGERLPRRGYDSLRSAGLLRLEPYSGTDEVTYRAFITSEARDLWRRTPEPAGAIR
jgi:hypothetical protein